MMRALLILGFLMLPVFPAQALGVDEPLDDPVLEARARAIMMDIRCLVCQNQSIEDSNADLAKDLRQIIREKILAGEGEVEIHSFLVERYGDWILMEPPLGPKTYILWLGPFLLLLMGAAALFWDHKKQTLRQAQALSVDEKRRVMDLMGEDGGGQ